jgi:hypothetical protein
MATRGIIAVTRAGDGAWRGRYAHWDNYPERIVPVLDRLIRRDGATQVVETLINNNQSWSVVDDKQELDDPMLGNDTASVVVGYGRIHLDLEPNDPTSWFTEDDIELAWADWVYVIHHSGIEVMKVVKNDEGNDVAVPDKFHLWEEIPNLPHPYMVGA